MAKKRVSAMKKPIPEQFGLTSQEHKYLVVERARLREILDRPPSYGHWLEALIMLPIISLISAFLFGSIGSVAGLFITAVLSKMVGQSHVGNEVIIVAIIIGAAYGFIAVLTKPYIERKKRARYRKELLDSKYNKVVLYEEANRRYEYRQKGYWKSLKGTKFERALARLYSDMNYSVQNTKGSSDEGVDLILSKDKKKTVVQCKGHKKPIGVGAVRELYGAMMHFGAESAVLACPAGFTNGVRKFVIGKPIQLLSVKELVEMAESVSQESGNR